MSTPSARIAAELAEQIRAGRLQPGELIPSAREIARTWNVAIATASRAHALLRSEGLVLPLPGVGTVVAEPGATSTGVRPHARAVTGRARPPARLETGDDPLTADRIIAAGIAIADAEGVEVLSMRRVAHALRTRPTSLYRHVASKEDLLLRMMDRAFDEWTPGEQSGTWRDCLISGHRELWRVFRRHAWLAPQFSVTRPQLIPSALVFAEWAMQTLGRTGAGVEEAFEAHLLLFTQVRGTAILLEPEAEAEAASGIDADTWVDGRIDTLRELTAVAHHRGLRSLVGSGYELDLDRLFERGLVLLVDGIASRLRRAPAE